MKSRLVCNCSANKRWSYYHDSSCRIEKHYRAIENRRHKKHDERIAAQARADERAKMRGEGWQSYTEYELKEAYKKGQADLEEMLKVRLKELNGQPMDEYDIEMAVYMVNNPEASESLGVQGRGSSLSESGLSSDRLTRSTPKPEKPKKTHLEPAGSKAHPFSRGKKSEED